MLYRLSLVAASRDYSLIAVSRFLIVVVEPQALGPVSFINMFTET